MANFIPPANGASQGNFFQAKTPKMAVFEAFATSLLALLAGDNTCSPQTSVVSIYSDKLAHLQVVINFQYLVAQMDTREETLTHF